MATNDLIVLVREMLAQIAMLQAELDEVRALLAGEPPVESSATRATNPRVAGRVRGRRKRRQGSVTWAAEVARESKDALHVDQMIERIFQKRGERVDKQTLVSNLARLVKNGQGWRRVAPNTFELTGH
jgi:hypothetical protein